MIIFLLFILGLCFGSFLNVLIDRIPLGKSVVTGRSQCDYCHHQLAFYDLIPVVSFLFLLGKCRYCHKKLSWQYPIVELATGVLFVSTYLFENPVTTQGVYIFSVDVLIASCSLALAIMDMKYRILSDQLLIVVTLLTLGRLILFDVHQLLSHIFIACLSILPLFLLYIFSKGRGMGFGDVKLIGVLGFLLGFPGIIITYYIAFLTGAVSGILLIVGQKKKLKGTTIAFGPFLFIGAAFSAVYGAVIWNYAKTLFGF